MPAVFLPESALDPIFEVPRQICGTVGLEIGIVIRHAPHAFHQRVDVPLFRNDHPRPRSGSGLRDTGKPDEAFPFLPRRFSGAQSPYEPVFRFIQMFQADCAAFQRTGDDFRKDLHRIAILVRDIDLGAGEGEPRELRP